MSETVTVKNVGDGRPWEHGITYWDVVLERNGAGFPCVWGKKDTPPMLGEEVEGEFFEKDGEWRFRKASKPQGSSTSSEGSSSGGKSDNWKPKAPEEIAGARHAHNLLVATKNLSPLPASPSEMEVNERLHLLAGMAETLDDETAGISKAAQGGGGASRPDPAPAQNDTHQRLETLLEGAGVNSAAARVITNYALSEMTTEEQDAAIDRLSKPDFKVAAVNRLRERAESHYGSDLPAQAPETDNVPF